MSSSSTGGDAARRVGSEASPPVSLSMEGVLSIRGVDGSTGETIPIDVTPSLRRANDPYRADVVRWVAMDVSSIMVEEDLTKLREAYRIPADIEFILPGPNERACFPRRGFCPKWMESNGGEHVLIVSTFLRHGDASACVPNHISAEEVAKEVGWYYFCPWGSHRPLVTGCPSSIKQWKESWFWVSGNWQRVFDDPEPDLDVPSVYGIASGSEDLELRIDPEPTPLPSGARIDGLQRKAIEDLGRAGNKEVAEASKVIEVEDVPEAEVPLSRKRKAKSSRTGASQATASAVEVADTYAMSSVPPFQRTLAVNTSGEVVLEGPFQNDPNSGRWEWRAL
ncbi:Uncharacterized protein Adt_04262 [Abeliophyllum distichum]|uniref:Uncharacterized protein n=1 Tax=Abeliophyllum distichum TaxID=126358 RepID=A0ABD1W0T9_9LAMI